jgi:copper(I)-binding protein
MQWRRRGNMNIAKNFLAITLALATSTAWTADAAKSVAQTLRVSNAWVRSPAPGQKVAGAYLEITSARSAALVGAASPSAARVEIHETTNEGGIMRMRPVQRVELASGRTVKLVPNGLHLMLFDLTQPLKLGDKVPLTLTVEEPGASVTNLKVDFEVRAVAPTSHHH